MPRRQRKSSRLIITPSQPDAPRSPPVQTTMDQYLRPCQPNLSLSRMDVLDETFSTQGTPDYTIQDESTPAVFTPRSRPITPQPASPRYYSASPRRDSPSATPMRSRSPSPYGSPRSDTPPPASPDATPHPDDAMPEDLQVIDQCLSPSTATRHVPSSMMRMLDNFLSAINPLPASQPPELAILDQTGGTPAELDILDQTGGTVPSGDVTK